jgi:hypothetical protein
MKSRNAATVIVATAQRLIRADFSDQVTGPAKAWNSSRVPASSTPEAVRAALALGGRPMRRVLVLCEDFWCQPVTLSAAQTSRLSKQEEAQALGFEVEPFSNISPLEATVGFRVTRQSNGISLYWVVECLDSELSAIRAEVERAGSRLVGVSHPGGLPFPIGEVEPREPWHRSEQWTRTSLWVHGGGRDSGVSVQTAGVGQPSEQAGPTSEYGERLVAGERDAAVPGDDGASLFSLADPGQLGQWLQAWVRGLDRAPAELALVQPPPRATPIHRYVLAGAVAEAVVAAFCLTHWLWFSIQHAHLRTEVSAAREAVGRIAAVEQENTQLNQTLTQLGQARRERENVDRALIQRRRALSCLLRAVAAVRLPSLVMQEIQDEGEGSLVISGMGMAAGAGDEFSTRLSDALRETGWTVAPLGNVAEGFLDNAGPWRFAVRVALTDGTPPAGAVAAASATAAGGGGAP